MGHPCRCSFAPERQSQGESSLEKAQGRQIDLTYNSNHIEGNRLTHEQTRHIFETNTIGITDESVNIDDIVETTNHFRCIDIIIDRADERLTEELKLFYYRGIREWGKADGYLADTCLTAQDYYKKPLDYAIWLRPGPAVSSPRLR